MIDLSVDRALQVLFDADLFVLLTYQASTPKGETLTIKERGR